MIGISAEDKAKTMSDDELARMVCILKAAGYWSASDAHETLLHLHEMNSLLGASEVSRSGFRTAEFAEPYFNEFERRGFPEGTLQRVSEQMGK